MATPDAELDATVRAQWPRILAWLMRTIGDWDLAEDCAQDAVERALRTWPRDGVPDNPGAWLTAVARRRALDVLRRRATESRALQACTAQAQAEAPTLDAGGGFADDRLRLLFTCCHPLLTLQDRVALTLRSVCGLPTRDIARLLLVREAAMSQRLRRVRQQIVRSGLALEVPPADEVEERIGAVLAVIYLLFTQGYAVTVGDAVRDELAEEAITLAALLTCLLPREAEAHALRALILLQHARRPARFSPGGELVPLEDQARGLWDRPLLAAGLQALRIARGLTETDGVVGVYRPQAEIAALHSTAASAGSTDWAEIVGWYDALLAAGPAPVVELSRVVAVGMRDGAAAGLAELDEVAGRARVEGLAEVPAIRADLLRRAGRRAEARAAYEEAVVVAPNESARRFLQARLTQMTERQ